MDFYEVIKKRRSVRSYQSTPVPEDALNRIAEAVQLAPSACNLQPWKFKVITNPEMIAAIAANYSRDWLKDAPAIAVLLGNEKEAWKRFDGKTILNVDIGIAMEHFVLAATAEGLATCWICAYDVPKMNDAVKAPLTWNALAITPLGYSDAEVKDVPRKPINKIFEIVD